jgi:prepilin signal peptidase PulO-like enzyme (type II secretory pathway)
LVRVLISSSVDHGLKPDYVKPDYKFVFAALEHVIVKARYSVHVPVQEYILYQYIIGHTFVNTIIEGYLENVKV